MLNSPFFFKRPPEPVWALGVRGLKRTAAPSGGKEGEGREASAKGIFTSLQLKAELSGDRPQLCHGESMKKLFWVKNLCL